MDVSHLVPTPTGSSAAGAAATRVRTERAPFETATLAAQETSAAERPIAGAVHVADRIERSPELTQTLAELSLLLARTSEAPQERIDSLRLEVADGSLAAGPAFETAALALLHREPSVAPNDARPGV